MVVEAYIFISGVYNLPYGSFIEDITWRLWSLLKTFVSLLVVCLRCIVKPSIVETPNLTILPNLILHNFLVDLFLWIHLLSFLFLKFPKSSSKLPSDLVFCLSVLYWLQNHFCSTWLLFLAWFPASFMFISFSDSEVLVFKNPYFIFLCFYHNS